ncbi:hypothetical protein PUN28_010715 [Cardiocondyla obscurior]|uniref:Uncharacterized protein n=1 Tax=Cardiocondyla obscurior TaxID=286306 RepID=A0AAW2FJE8_9HYME
MPAAFPSGLSDEELRGSAFCSTEEDSEERRQDRDRDRGRRLFLRPVNVILSYDSILTEMAFSSRLTVFHFAGPVAFSGKRESHCWNLTQHPREWTS